MTDPFRLDGARAPVTGAKTGIGQGVTVALAPAEAEVDCGAVTPWSASRRWAAAART